MYKFDEETTDKNYILAKADPRYKGKLGYTANLIAHKWNMIEHNGNYYLTDWDIVYDPLLDLGHGNFWKQCRLGKSYKELINE